MTAPRPVSGPMAAVAAVGTAVGALGIAHTLFDALRGDGAPLWAAAAESVIACVFLEGVVVVCATRARQHAAGSRAAKLDVSIVLAAALVSGLVSGLHAGWNTAGLLRFSIPLVAAACWLGDLVHLLRTRVRDDREQLLRRVVLAAGKRKRLASSRLPWRAVRAETSLVKAINAYEAESGDAGTLVTRLERVHHMDDLLAPLGPSPWRIEQVTSGCDLTLPRPVPALWSHPLRTPVLPVPDTCPETPADGLLPLVRALLRADPDMGRPRLIEQLRERGISVGSDRAAALLRAARAAVPDSQVNGHRNP